MTFPPLTNEKMTFGDACRELRRRGFVMLLDMSPRRKQPPRVIDDAFIASNERRLAGAGNWVIVDTKRGMMMLAFWPIADDAPRPIFIAIDAAQRQPA